MSRSDVKKKANILALALNLGPPSRASVTATPHPSNATPEVTSGATPQQPSAASPQGQPTDTTIPADERSEWLSTLHKPAQDLFFSHIRFCCEQGFSCDAFNLIFPAFLHASQHDLSYVETDRALQQVEVQARLREGVSLTKEELQQEERDLAAAQQADDSKEELEQEEQHIPITQQFDDSSMELEQEECDLPTTQQCDDSRMELDEEEQDLTSAQQAGGSDSGVLRGANGTRVSKHCRKSPPKAMVSSKTGATSKAKTSPTSGPGTVRKSKKRIECSATCKKANKKAQEKTRAATKRDIEAEEKSKAEQAQASWIVYREPKVEAEDEEDDASSIPASVDDDEDVSTVSTAVVRSEKAAMMFQMMSDLSIEGSVVAKDDLYADQRKGSRGYKVSEFCSKTLCHDERTGCRIPEIRFVWEWDEMEWLRGRAGKLPANAECAEFPKPEKPATLAEALQMGLVSSFKPSAALEPASVSKQSTEHLAAPTVSRQPAPTTRDGPQAPLMTEAELLASLEAEKKKAKQRKKDSEYRKYGPNMDRRKRRDRVKKLKEFLLGKGRMPCA